MLAPRARAAVLAPCVHAAAADKCRCASRGRRVLGSFSPNGRSKKHDLMVSTYQACILLIFNEQDSYSFNDMQQARAGVASATPSLAGTGRAPCRRPCKSRAPRGAEWHALACSLWHASIARADALTASPPPRARRVSARRPSRALVDRVASQMLNLPAEELKRYALSLCLGKYKILIKEPNNKEAPPQHRHERAPSRGCGGAVINVCCRARAAVRMAR